MTNFRFISLAVVLASASALVACSTAPAMPMGAAPPNSRATPDPMTKMDAQMNAMRDMHEKMMNAKTPEERSKLMAEHMKTMKEGMEMMSGMPSAGRDDMKGMQGMQGMQGAPGMSGDMGARQQMMEKRMEMMQAMMKMMMDRMQAMPAK